MRILLVEDNAALSGLISQHLAALGHIIDFAQSVEEAEHAISVTTPDLVLLDLGLPDGDGLTFLSRLRRSNAVPLIILTARDAVESRVAGLDLGADDYLVKPFDLSELEARMRAVMRRPGDRRPDSVEFSDISFDPAARDVQVRGSSVELGPKEFALLEVLIKAAPRIVVKDMLEDRLYALHEPVTPNAIEAIVSRLRRKLVAARSQTEIVTVRGIGYKLAEV